jgi:hypothetical protein
MYYNPETVSFTMTKEEKKDFEAHVEKTRETNLKMMTRKTETHREYCIRHGITQNEV